MSDEEYGEYILEAVESREATLNGYFDRCSGIITDRYGNRVPPTWERRERWCKKLVETFNRALGELRSLQASAREDFNCRNVPVGVVRGYRQLSEMLIATYDRFKNLMEQYMNAGEYITPIYDEERRFWDEYDKWFLDFTDGNKQICP